MTIVLFSGRPGSGKSYDAMRHIRNALRYQKKDVIANFEVNADERWKGHFTYLPNSGITAGNIVALARDYWAGRDFKENGLLLALDECQLLFNSRTWQSSDRMEFLELMSQHRKYGLKIILIAQSDIMIDKQFRALIEYETNHRKLGNYGKFGFILNLLLFGGVFYACTYYYAQKVKVGGEWFRYSKKIAKMYDSYKTFEQKTGAEDANASIAPAPAHGIISENHAIMTESESNHDYSEKWDAFNTDYDDGSAISDIEEGGLQDGDDRKQDDLDACA